VVSHGGSPDPGFCWSGLASGLPCVVDHGGSPDPGFCGGVVWPGGSPWWILVVLSSGSGLVVPL
jgi:hypothetical protein